MKQVIVLVAALLVAACGSLGGTREADRFFILERAPGSVVAPQGFAAVVVAPTTASSFYDTQDIVYSRTPGTRAYYQFSHWTERPQRAVHAQLVARLGTAARPGALVLTTHLEEIYHDAARQPGTAQMTMTAQLIDPASHAVLARRSFNGTAPAASYDAAGAVDGMRQVLGTLLDEVLVWVTTQAPQSKGS